MSAPPLSPKLLARHPGRAGLTSDQREKFICSVHCSTGHNFPGSPGGLVEARGGRAGRLRPPHPTRPQEALQRSDLGAGLHIKVYFETKLSMGKVCKIQFKHRDLEHRH